MCNAQHIGIRKAVAIELGYNDRNDGFCRTKLSRSKWNHSRIRKEHKPVRIKPDTWINWIY